MYDFDQQEKKSQRTTTTTAISTTNSNNSSGSSTSDSQGRANASNNAKVDCVKMWLARSISLIF